MRSADVVQSDEESTEESFTDTVTWVPSLTLVSFDTTRAKFVFGWYQISQYGHINARCHLIWNVASLLSAITAFDFAHTAHFLAYCLSVFAPARFLSLSRLPLCVFFFQVPIYLNSFPFFFIRLHWFPNPSLCRQLGSSCVSAVECVCVCVCVCFSGTVLSQWAECEKTTDRERERLRKSRLSFWTTEENWARNQRDLSGERETGRARARQRGVQAPRFISGAPQTRELRRQTQRERERGEIK